MNKEITNYFKEVSANFTWKKFALINLGVIAILCFILFLNYSSSEKESILGYKNEMAKEQIQKISDSIASIENNLIKRLESELKMALANSQLNYDNSVQIESEYTNYINESQAEIDYLKQKQNKKHKVKDEKITNDSSDSLNASVRDYIRTSYQNRYFK